MSRFLILFLFLIWTAWPGSAKPPAVLPWQETALFLGVFALIVLVLGVWSRVLARHVTGQNLHRSIKRFNQAIFAARMTIPVWFGVGVFVLDWPLVVERLLGPVVYWPVQLPGAALGTLPAVMTWMGLWWSQYPADRALREQGLLVLLEDGLPVHSPPSFWDRCASWVTKLRSRRVDGPSPKSVSRRQSSRLPGTVSSSAVTRRNSPSAAGAFWIPICRS